tara:strand:- start:677 stop:1186 length:510 start_codon:yes stop_codon:yes gene_type:complete
MQNEIVWINQAIDSGGTAVLDVTQLRRKKSRYLGEFQDLLAQNTFLMLFSHLEEWLFHVHKSFASCIDVTNSRGNIRRYGDVLDHLGVDRSKATWSFLCDCADVRDCLLHANGRVSLAKNADRLKTITERTDWHVSVDSDRLRIGGKFVLKLQRAIGDLFDQAGLATGA